MPPRAKAVRLDPTDTGPLDGKVIVIDPGHNGLNYEFVDVMRPGATKAEQEICNTAGSETSAGVEEAAIVWDISEELVPVLRRSGAAVVLTRPDNNGFGPCADERGAIAAFNNADLFVSLHADGDTSGGSGYHLIYPGEKPNVSANAVAESLRFVKSANYRLRLAGLLPSNYTGEDGLKQRTNLANLNIANRASMLAELGNLVHPRDSEMLSDTYSRQVIANALALSIMDFFGVEIGLEKVDLNGDDEADVDPMMTLPTTSTTTTSTSSTTTTSLPLETIVVPVPTETAPTSIAATTPPTQPVTTSTTQPTTTTTAPTTTTSPVTQTVPIG